MNKAVKLALARKRLAQQSQPKTVLVDQADSTMPLQNGGFRPGKRKRGNSPLRRQAKTAVTVTRYVMRDEHGQKLGEVSLVTTKPDKRERYKRP